MLASLSRGRRRWRDEAINCGAGGSAVVAFCVLPGVRVTETRDMI